MPSSLIFKSHKPKRKRPIRTAKVEKLRKLTNLFVALRILQLWQSHHAHFSKVCLILFTCRRVQLSEFKMNVQLVPGLKKVFKVKTAVRQWNNAKQCR